jgi:hypothetical protein
MKMRLLLIILATAPAIANSSFADDRFVDENCSSIKDCTPTRDCATSSYQPDTRECHACLLKNPLTGNCIQRGNDPICEASKAAQNAAMAQAVAAKRMECESAKTSEKLLCETAKSKAIAQCTAIKASQKGGADENNYQKLLLLESAQAPLPATVISALTTHDVYQEQFLKTLTVSALSDNHLIPPPFVGSPVLTAGNRIFLEPGVDEAKISLRDWIKVIETARLFAEYGFAGMTQALTKDAPAILGLVDAKASKLCTELAC